LVDYLKSKEETYGVLGLAAGLLLTLYALGWAIAAGAALNAELVARKRRQHVLRACWRPDRRHHLSWLGSKRGARP
jgi:uncharacterized BrkB/YihY/UPF0761 family membrane protein